MSSDENSEELTEKIKILATDDEKIKSFGELFTNDSSREILQILFNEELTATLISQKTGISLQLVKYHLNKLQNLGVVKIVKIEKNSKSQDMKIYSATKFSIVIVPPKFSEKTKESKLLVRSFRHIYKVAGLGLATGISGLLSLSVLQKEKQIPVENSKRTFDVEESPSQLRSAAPMDDEVTLDTSESESIMAKDQNAELESFTDVEVLSSLSDTGSTNDLFFALVILTACLAGVTLFYLWKFFKK